MAAAPDPSGARYLTLAACRHSPVWWGCSPSRRCCSSAPPGCGPPGRRRPLRLRGRGGLVHQLLRAVGRRLASPASSTSRRRIRGRRPLRYEARPTRGESSGSWPRFLAALLVGFGVVGLALRRRPDVPRWLRLTAVATLAFAVAGVGADLRRLAGKRGLGMVYGVPVAFAADRWLRPGRGFDHPPTAGLTGAAVALAAAIVAATAYCSGSASPATASRSSPSRRWPRCRGDGCRNGASSRRRYLQGVPVALGRR